MQDVEFWNVVLLNIQSVSARPLLDRQDEDAVDATTIVMATFLSSSYLEIQFPIHHDKMKKPAYESATNPVDKSYWEIPEPSGNEMCNETEVFLPSWADAMILE